MPANTTRKLLPLSKVLLYIIGSCSFIVAGFFLAKFSVPFFAYISKLPIILAPCLLIFLTLALTIILFDIYYTSPKRGITPRFYYPIIGITLLVCAIATWAYNGNKYNDYTDFYAYYYQGYYCGNAVYNHWGIEVCPRDTNSYSMAVQQGCGTIVFLRGDKLIFNETGKVIASFDNDSSFQKALHDMKLFKLTNFPKN